MVHVLYSVTTVTSALVALILAIRTKLIHDRKDREERAFVQLAFLVFIFCAADTFWGLSAAGVFLWHREQMIFLSTLMHGLAAFMSYAWLDYALVYLGENADYPRLCRVIVGGMVLTQWAFLGMNLKNGCIFFIAPESLLYEAGPLRNLPFCLQYGVFLVIAVISSVMMTRTGRKKLKRKYLALLFFVASPICCGIIQMLYAVIPAYSIGYMLGLTIIYTFSVSSIVEKRRQSAAEAVKRSRLEERLAITRAIAEDFAFIGMTDTEKEETQAVHASPAVAKLWESFGSDTGFAEVPGKLMKFIHPEDRDFFLRASDPETIRRNLEENGVYKFEVRFTIDGEERYYRLKFIQPGGDSKKIVVGLINVDEQVRSEMARGEEAGYQRAQAFADAFLHTYVSAYYVDLRDCSQTVFHRDGYIDDTYGDIQNYLESINSYISLDVHEDDRAAMYEAVQPDYIRKRLAEEERFSVYMRDISGPEMRWYRFDVSRGVDEDHAGIAFTDVTEKIAADEAVKTQLEQQQRELEKALDMAQSSNRAKTTFLNNMSHDIRTPMNAIIGFTRLAENHIDSKDVVRDYLDKINQSSNHLLSLINDVLDMSRIESGKMSLEEKAEDLAKIVHTLRNIVLADVNAKQLNLTVDIVDVVNERIVCDKLRLNQALLNLMSNAIKYTMPGGSVSLRISQKGVTPEGRGCYEFRIRDNGIGMDSEFVKTVFEPFTRESTATVSGIQGTGLGMAITKNIVDMMGGTIEVHSARNEGTEFVLNLDFRLAGDEPELTGPVPGLQNKRCLVADDSTVTCINVAKMLKDLGLRSEWCVTGHEALVRAEEAMRDGDAFDVCILDGMMPDMNGIETARRLRRVVGDEMSILLLSAYDWSDMEEEARETGIREFLAKPLFPSDLRRAMIKCCSAEETTQEDAETGYDFTGRKILLVEDNALNREIATEILEETGFVVDTAEDGIFAVDKMQRATEDTYDLILMDIQMPMMDGYDATRAIRALPAKFCAAIPIIAMTANAFEEDRQMAISAGMNEHLAKPIDIHKLLAVISRFVK